MAGHLVNHDNTPIPRPSRKAQTLIVRYPCSQMLGQVKALVSKQTNQVVTGHAFISRFIEVDIYCNIDKKPDEYPWASVVYECIQDNESLSAVKRYPNHILVTVDANLRLEVQNETLSR